MDPVLLARIQFALTIGFHFLFPPLTIGLAWLIFWFMSRYKKTGLQIYADQVKFWVKLFAISFAIGVATGITMEFQFGTNWSKYSKFVGDIFGAPLAAEGIMAFFLESTFLGVLLFGWKRFSTWILWFASLMVALGSTLSAFWIIVADSWMQTPAGYALVDDRAVLTDFFAAVFNPSTVERYTHTVAGCLITGAFFMMGISAWYLLKGKNVEFAKRSLRLSLIVGFIFSVAQLPIGHMHAIQVAETQPEKLATFEGIFETQKNAPALIFGIPDAEERKIHAAIEIPSGLSMMIAMDPEYEVKGLNDFPRDEWPPVAMTFFSFHFMVYLGAWFIFLTAVGLFLLWRKKLYGNKLFMKAAIFSIPLPFLANELGWIAAEVGRQPWVVYRMPGMRTAQAVSITVSAGEILASIIMFVILYTLLGAVWIRLLRRAIRRGPFDTDGKERIAKETGA